MDVGPGSGKYILFTGSVPPFLLREKSIWYFRVSNPVSYTLGFRIGALAIEEIDSYYNYSTQDH